MSGTLTAQKVPEEQRTPGPWSSSLGLYSVLDQKPHVTVLGREAAQKGRRCFNANPVEVLSEQSRRVLNPVLVIGRVQCLPVPLKPLDVCF